MMGRFVNGWECRGCDTLYRYDDYPCPCPRCGGPTRELTLYKESLSKWWNPWSWDRVTLRRRTAWEVLDDLTGAVEGPQDWASEADHYIYGTAKRGPVDPSDLTPRVLAKVGFWITEVDTHGSTVLLAKGVLWNEVIAEHGIPAAIALLSYGQPGGLTRDDIPKDAFLGCGHPYPPEK